MILCITVIATFFTSSNAINSVFIQDGTTMKIDLENERNICPLQIAIQSEPVGQETLKNTTITKSFRSIKVENGMKFGFNHLANNQIGLNTDNDEIYGTVFVSYQL